MRHLSDLLPFRRRGDISYHSRQRPRADAPGADFQGWEARRVALEKQLNFTREGVDDDARERLFGELSTLERLIIETPSDDPSALRAKASILLWYMEMEQADGLPAMRHIAGFLDRLH